jgi:hypothetical protein
MNRLAVLPSVHILKPLPFTGSLACQTALWNCSPARYHQAKKNFKDLASAILLSHPCITHQPHIMPIRWMWTWTELYGKRLSTKTISPAWQHGFRWDTKLGLETITARENVTVSKRARCRTRILPPRIIVKLHRGFRVIRGAYQIIFDNKIFPAWQSGKCQNFQVWLKQSHDMLDRNEIPKSR